VEHSWKLRFTKLFIVIGEVVFNIRNCHEHVRFAFTKVRIAGQQNYTTGDIKEMKLEFGQNIDINAAPQGPEGSDYEHGSARVVVQAADSNGTDVSDQFTATQDPENELHISVVRAAGNNTECSGSVTLRADGDPDADEEAPVVGVLGFAYDSPNVTGFELTGTAVTPETPLTPEENATPEEPA
jgi:hypothetical protein